MENFRHTDALEYLRNRRQLEFSVFEKTRKEILKHKKRLKDQLERYEDLLMKQLTTSWMKINENVTKQERQLLEEGEISSKETSRQETLTLLPIERVPCFCPGKLSEEVMSKLFGELQVYVNNELEITKTHSFDTDLTYINPLCPISDNIAFVGCAVDKIVQKVCLQPKLTILTDIKTFKPLEPCSVVAQKSGGLIVSSSNDTSLKVMDADGSLELLHDFDPLIPKGVCVTEENSIIVGLREATRKPFVIERHSTRQVHRLDYHGRTRHIYEFDEKQNRLFTVPSRITENNHNIFVQDMKEEDRGRIIAVSFSGKVAWIYNGHAFSQYPFCPNDMTLSSSGLLIITDTYNNALHFLNVNGEIILYKTLMSVGITLPCSVAMDYKGRLWVGTGKDKKKNAKIHVLSISE